MVFDGMLVDNMFLKLSLFPYTYCMSSEFGEKPIDLSDSQTPLGEGQRAGHEAERISKTSQPSAVIQWLLRSGVVKTEAQARYAVFGLAGIVLLAALVLFGGGGDSDAGAIVPSGYEIINNPGEPPRLDRPYFGN